MKIGVLYEGVNDEVSLNILINKLLAHKISEKNVFINIPAHGGIYNKINSGLEIFFGDDLERVDLAILVSDYDKNHGIERDIRDLVRNNSYSQAGEKIVCAFCDPHFEEWFIAEEDAIKHVLGYPAPVQLPYEDLEEKDQLEKLIENSDVAGDV